MRCLAVLLLLTAPSPCCADPPSSLPFLKAGSDYIIQFPAHLDAFTERQSSINLGDVLQKKSPPVTTEQRHVVHLFTVRELGPGNWALLQHPSSLTDASAWNLQRTSAARLNPKTIAELEASEAGMRRLERLRRAAEVKIQTTETWVNLSHALSISSPPTDASEPPLKIKVNASFKTGE